MPKGVYPRTPIPIEPRFWGKVCKSGNNGCWLWQGAEHRPNGYGQIRIARKTLFAHRLAWIYRHGPIPSGLYVLHHCDNPKCVNPEHLFLGTQLDNIRDMIAKGRNAKPKARKAA